MKLCDCTHPLYTTNYADWCKYRLTYNGGDAFINAYLKKLSSLETDAELLDRKSIAYCPPFAASAVDEIKNAIYQRTADVVREGGSRSYQRAIMGLDGGVDLQGNAISTFIGQEVLIELLVMQYVGVLTDNARDLGETEADKGNKHPYFTVYPVESIRSWYPEVPVNGYDSLLLEERVLSVDPQYGLPTTYETKYRYMRKERGGVLVQIRNGKDDIEEEYFLNIPEIPFTLFKLPRSLMKNVADYQIALLNLESGDISFTRKANYPFFYEFFEPRSENTFTKPSNTGGTGAEAEQKARQNVAKTGLTQGRRYPSSCSAPGFINPSPETLKVSMEKGRQLKEDIRIALNLNLVAMNPRRQAAESKELDNRSLEAGLSFIGLELQRGEYQMARHWSMFEGDKNEIKITYPKTYNLRTEQERQEEAERLQKISDNVPSPTFQRALKRKIALTAIGGDVTEGQLQTIFKEIESAQVLTVEPDVILRAHEQGLMSDVDAAKALGMLDAETSIVQAKKDRAERIRLTLEAQGGVQSNAAARGAPELGGTTSEEEKKGKPTRGPGKKINKVTEE